MPNLDKFKSPAAKKLMTLGAVTIGTSIVFSTLPKGLSVALITTAAAVITAKHLDKNNSFSN